MWTQMKMNQFTQLSKQNGTDYIVLFILCFDFGARGDF